MSGLAKHEIMDIGEREQFEATLRKQIAREILAERGNYDNANSMHNDYWYAALTKAAAIAGGDK